MSLADFQQRVDDLVRDRDQVISTTTRDSAIATAVDRYSKVFPRAVVVDATSAGGDQLDLPAGWQTDFSVLRAIEQPIDETPRAWWDMDQVRIYIGPAATVIELPIELTAGDIARLTYTQRHVVDASTDTVPSGAQHAIACLAASILCGQLANYYATDSDSTIQADSVDHRRKSDLYRSRERELRTLYFSALGVGETRATVASATVNLQANDSRGGDRLYHARRYR